MGEVRSIEFVFENCEYLELKSHLLGSVNILGIRESIRRIDSNSVQRYKSADEIVLEILPGAANEEYCPFGFEDKKTNKMERLSDYNDITHIIVKYKDGTMDDISVDYDEGENEGELGAPNVNQKVYMSPGKHLYIVITKGKEISDYFSKEDIDFSDEITEKFCGQEGFLWGEEGYPEYYRYAYVTGTTEQDCGVCSSLIVMLPNDRNSMDKGNRFYYVDSCDNDNPHIKQTEVKTWSYQSRDVEKLLVKEPNKELIMEILKNNKPDGTDKGLMEMWNEAFMHYGIIIEEAGTLSSQTL